MEFLRVESDRQISSIKTAVKEIGKISIPQFGPLGLGTDFAGLKRTAGYQAARNKASEEGGVLGSAKAYAIDIGTGTFGKRYQDQLDTFNSIQSKIQSASTQITIAFTQEKESLALLNAQYSDGLITREEYDAQFAISMDNLTKLEEVTRDLVVELDKIDESGELSAAAVKDLGNEALAALKKTNPALFKKISAALAELDANAQIDIYMGYAAGSLTILDLAKLPQVLKDIDGKSASVALNIIGNAGLSTGAAGLASIPVLEADLKRVNKLLEAGYNTDLIRERDSLIKQIAAAKKAQTDAAKVNQTGSLDTDNANKGGATGGAGKFLNPYEKELDLLKKKRDALKEVNDELDRQNQYQMKQLDLINQAAKAKMTGDYLQAASLQQQSLLEGAKFARESRIVQMDRIIGQVEERSSIVADTKKLTSVDQTLLKKLRAGSYGSIAALPTTPNVGFGAKPGATGVTGTNIGGSVYNVTMNVTGSNAEEISNKVIAKLKLAESKMNKTNRIPL